MKKINVLWVMVSFFALCLFISPNIYASQSSSNSDIVLMADNADNLFAVEDNNPDKEKGKKDGKCCDKDKKDCKSKADASKACCSSDKAKSTDGQAKSGCAGASRADINASGDCSKRSAGVGNQPKK